MIRAKLLSNSRRYLIFFLSVVSILIVLLKKNDVKELQEVMQEVVQNPSEVVEIMKRNQGGEKMRRLLKPNGNSTKEADNKMKDIVDRQKCKIPKLNPWDPEILPSLRKPRLEKCKNKRYGVMEKNTLKLKAKDVVSAFMFYIIRVTDFKTRLSKKIHLFGDEGVTVGSEMSFTPCWEDCGTKGGPCPDVCGKNGFCCRRGFPDCPGIPKALMHESSHACVTMKDDKSINHKPCWDECGSKGGPCPKVCGEKGHCCRKGFQDCPNVPEKLMTASSHSCVTLKEDRFGKGKDCDITHDITKDYFKLVIVFPNNVHEEYHYNFLDKSKEWGISKTPPEDQLNIMVIIFDSLSHSHTQRSLRKTYKYLSEHPRTVIMKGHTIVADGTTGQLTAMFTGIPEKQQPEARRGFPGSAYVDNWKWMYSDLHKRHYMTMYSEEDAKKGFGTFQYRLNGFNKPPTIFFPRPLWGHMKHVIYNQISCPHEFHFKYIRDYFDANKDYNKFGVVFHNIMHNSLDTLENAEDDTFAFLKQVQESDHGNNTVVLLLGDHGLRTSDIRRTLTGKLEERLPLLSITYPSKLESFKTELKNLRTNSRLLTSHFDLHQTFQHISTFPHLNKQVHKHKLGRSLFSDIGKLNRSCTDAGVNNHWCTCLNYKKVDASKDKYLNRLVESILRFINDRNAKTVPKQCHTLKLKNIIAAGRRTPNAEVNQFKSTKTNKGGCDSCAVEYDKSKDFSRFVYEVTFVASPDNGESYRSLPVFEAGGEIVLKSDTADIKVDPTIGRINLYGNQPACIAAEYPHLRGFCICKNFKDLI